MSHKKTVLVDIDNTIAKTQHAYVNFANSVKGGAFKFESITKEFSDDQNDRFESLVREYISSTNYSMTVEAIEPYPNALIAFKNLKAAGFRICVASSRIENWHPSTAYWLEYHGFIQYIDQLFLRTEDIDSAGFKQEVAFAVQPQAVFDDSYQTAKILSSIDSVYLIAQPWNNYIMTTDNITRVSDFAEAVSIFLKKNQL